jgi:hypothetical protein
VIEGLRLLPFVAGLPVYDCHTCQHGNPKTNMTAQSEHVRRLQGCAYLSPLDGARPGFAVPNGCEVEPTVCPGYAISQPEVVEAVRLRPSWMKGYLVHHVGGEVPSVAFDAQNLLEDAVNTHQIAEQKRLREEAEANRGR